MHIIKNEKKLKKEFWSFIKSIVGSKSKSSNQISGNEWYNYFKSLLNSELHLDVDKLNDVKHEIDSHEVNCQLCEENAPVDLNCKFTVSEVELFIKKLPTGKATGNDGATNVMLKLCAQTSSSYLISIFNGIFNTGNFPEEWCKPIIIPLYKSGDVNKVNNHRGISLLSIVSKVFTGILNDRLKNGLKKINCWKNKLVLDKAEAQEIIFLFFKLLYFCPSSYYQGSQWQSGNTLASHLWGQGSVPSMNSSGKAGSCLPLEPWLTVCTGFLCLPITHRDMTCTVLKAKKRSYYQ